MRFSYAATIAAILLTSQAAIAGGLFPKVVVTVAPLKPYVDEIMHGHGQSQSLLRPGQEAHDFALAPSQAQMLDSADIVIVPDHGMSPMLKSLLTKKKALVIELSSLDGAEPLPYSTENPWLEAMKAKAKPKAEKHDHEAQNDDDAHEHTHASDEKTPMNDPHLWLDPERMAAIAVPLARAMAQKSPEIQATLVTNATTLAKHLRNEVMPQLRTMLNKKARMVDGMEMPQIPFITYHAGYQYFLARFRLTHYGEITTRPEEKMGAQTKASLLSGVESIRVRCLIGEQSSVLMERIAKATDAKIILLSPEQLVARGDVDALDWITSDYDRFIYKTAKIFSNCL
jgi:zinc transport system substrate-binding protein